MSNDNKEVLTTEELHTITKEELRKKIDHEIRFASRETIAKAITDMLWDMIEFFRDQYGEKISKTKEIKSKQKKKKVRFLRWQSDYNEWLTPKYRIVDPREGDIINTDDSDAGWERHIPPELSYVFYKKTDDGPTYVIFVKKEDA